MTVEYLAAPFMTEAFPIEITPVFSVLSIFL